MGYIWTEGDFNRFYNAIENMDFSGLDKFEVVANSIQNAFDVSPEEDPVGCAISTVEMYIDQGVSSF